MCGFDCFGIDLEYVVFCGCVSCYQVFDFGQYEFLVGVVECWCGGYYGVDGIFGI